MCDVTLAVLVDRISSFDFFIFLPLCLDEVEEDVIFEDGFVELGFLGLGEGGLDDADDFVVEQVVHVVSFHEVEHGWEEVSCPSDDIFGMEDVISEDESDDLDDLESAVAKFRSASLIDLQLLNTFRDEWFSQFDKLIDDAFIFRQDEGDIGEVGQ